MSGRAVREATAADMPALAGLLDVYMRELFERAFGGTAEQLARDALGLHARTLVAADGAELLGFAIWHPCYDVHHCVSGGQLLDLYVDIAARGGSLAPELLVGTIAAIARTGGRFIRGQGVAASADRLYGRLAVTFPGTEFTLGGRAFRELAALEGVPLRQALRRLPPKSANFEP